MKVYDLFIFSMLVTSCSGLRPHHSGHHSGHHFGHHSGHQHKQSANHHMLKKSHQDLIKTFDDPKRDLWQRPKDVLQLIGPIEGKNVIDIGSGSGYFTKYFVEAKALTTAADVDQHFLSHVHQMFSHDSHLKTKLIPYDDPKMGQEQFDVAFTANTYHHIEERVSYFKKVKKGLKAGGKLVVVDYKKIKNQSGPPLWMRLSSFEVAKELIEAGFDEVTIHQTLLDQQYIVIASKFKL